MTVNYNIRLSMKGTDTKLITRRDMTVWGQHGWILAKFFFYVFMDRDEVGVCKLAKKKRMRPVSSHLDQTSLVNKGFIIWLSWKLLLRDTAGSPERARLLHLARSGSQSQRRIRFILPAHRAGQVMRLIIISLCFSILANYFFVVSKRLVYFTCAK